MQKTVFLFLVLCLFVPEALALNLQSYRFSDSYRYALLEDARKESFPGKFVFTTSFGHVHSPFYVSDKKLNELRREIIKYNNVLTAGASYYISDALSVGVDLSAINNSVLGETYVDLADTILRGRYRFFQNERTSLSLNPQVYLPTGQEDNFSTVETLGASLLIAGEHQISRRLHVLGSIGGFSGKDNRYLEVDHRQLLLTQLGVSYDLSDRWNLNAEIYRNFPTMNDNLQDEGKYFLTAKHKLLSRASLYFGVGATGLGAVERNTYSTFIGIKFHEAPAAPVEEVIATPVAAPMRFEPVYFAHDRADLAPTELPKLDRFVKAYQTASMAPRILIEAYASRPGSRAYNLALTKRRGESVRRYLINNGISKEALSVRPHGEDHEHDPVEAKNRRIELTPMPWSIQ